MKQNRWKSKVLWLGLAAQVLSILVMVEVIDISQSEAIEALVSAVLTVLGAFGVVNDPTTADHL